MEIIKLGNNIPPEKEIKTETHVCDKCNTVFKYEGKDIKCFPGGCYVNCPGCGNMVSASKIFFQ